MPFHSIRRAARTAIRGRNTMLPAALSLALGIGAAGLILSVAETVLLRALPYPEPDRLVRVGERNPSQGWERHPAAPAKFVDWRDAATSFDDLAGYMSWIFNLTGEGEPERIAGARASASLFEALGVQPEVGRLFTPGEDRPGGDPVVLMGHGLWHRRFGADRALVGRALMLNGEPRMVIGVLPPGFLFPGEAELWIPLAMAPDELRRDTHYLSVLGRLRPGVSRQVAGQEMAALATRLADEHPATDRGWGIELFPLREEVVGDVRPTLLLLVSAAGLLLLLTCASVANLLLARAIDRSDEVAVRTALGAGAARIAGAVAVEGFLLAAAGGVAGTLLAAGGIRLLQILEPEGLPRLVELGVDGRTVLVVLGVATVSALVFVLAPILAVVRMSRGATLRATGPRTTAGAEQLRLRAGLVVVQIATALILLAGALSAVATYDRLYRVDPGFVPEGVLTFRVALSWTAYPADDDQVTFFRRLVAGIERLPGVEAAGAVSVLPLAGTDTPQEFSIVGRPAADPASRPAASLRKVTPGYLRSMRVRLLEGRRFSDRDGAADSPVAIVNEVFARRFLDGEPTLERRIVLASENEVERQIVGVVGGVRHSSVASRPGPEIYVPHAQAAQGWMTVVARTGLPPLAVAQDARRAVWNLDPEQPVFAVRPMPEVVGESLIRERLTAVVLSIFGVTALLAAVVAIYGIMAYSVSRRTHEMGIRRALGARDLHILELVWLPSLLLTLVGIVLGLAGAVALGRLMEGWLEGVAIADLRSLGIVAVALLAVALLAAYLPLHRARRLEPARLLRFD